jgi:nitrogen PTS system EIIA component
MDIEYMDSSIFSPDLIKVKYYALDKKSCLMEMAEFLFENAIISDLQVFTKAIYDREALMSTGIGRGVAIPHARTDVANKLKIAVYLLDNDLEFDSIDGDNVKIIFMIAVPSEQKDEYMKVLSAVSNFFRSDENRKKLLDSKSEHEIYNTLKEIKI